MTGTDASTDLVVFTDLDGCLLDERTYSFGPAREALERLRALEETPNALRVRHVGQYRQHVLIVIAESVVKR